MAFDHKEYYRKNREKILEKAKAWRAAHPDKVKAWNRKARKKHRKKINARERAARQRPHRRLRQCWNNLLKRCNNPRHATYRYYGGRGIKNFLTFEELKSLWERDNAAGMRKPSLDRVDSSRHYVLENCRIIEQSENSARKRGMKYQKGLGHGLRP